MSFEGEFPVDDVTLAMLEEACSVDNDEGRSHLHEFLEFGSEEESREEIEPGIVEVHYKPGRAPWAVHEIIVSLVQEIRRLREKEYKIS